LTDKRIAILGAGAIGGAIAGLLARAGVPVTVIDMWPENIEMIRTNGVKITTIEDEFVASPAIALHMSDVSTSGELYDIVFLAVKSYDTNWACHFIKPYLAPGGFVVSTQNSINEDAIANVLGWTRVVGAVVTFGAGIYAPGHVTFTSPRERTPFVVGEPSGLVTSRVKEVVSILENISGGGVTATTNLWGQRWSKLCVNSMANALAGATGLKSAETREVPEALRMCIRIAAEVVNVGTAHGVAIDPITGVDAELYPQAITDGAAMEDVEGILRSGARQVGVGRPSLAQDLMKGRRIEVDYLNGYVAAKGAEVGIATPVNDAIRGLANRVASGELAQSIDNLSQIPQ